MCIYVAVPSDSIHYHFVAIGKCSKFDISITREFFEIKINTKGKSPSIHPDTKNEVTGG